MPDGTEKKKYLFDVDRDTYNAVKEMKEVTGVPMRLLLREMVTAFAEHFGAFKKELKRVRDERTKPIKLGNKKGKV